MAWEVTAGCSPERVKYFGMTHGPVFNRRVLLRTTMIGGLAVGLPIGVATSAAAGPALLRTDRPVLTHGVQSGDRLAPGPARPRAVSCGGGRWRIRLCPR